MKELPENLATLATEVQLVMVLSAYNELGEMYDKLVDEHDQLVEQFLRNVEAHTSLTRTYLSLLAGLGK